MMFQYKTFFYLALIAHCLHSHASDSLKNAPCNDAETTEFICRNALTLYSAINASPHFRYPNPGEHCKTSSLSWNTSFAPYNFNGMNGLQSIFILKTGVTVTEGLKDLLEKGGIVECMIVLSFVQEMILNALEENAVQQLTLPRTTILDCIYHDYDTPQNPGEWGYFSNVLDYIVIHPKGNANGLNVICVSKTVSGEPLYTPTQWLTWKKNIQNRQIFTK
jgi:hypothetical protein